MRIYTHYLYSGIVFVHDAIIHARYCHLALTSIFGHDTLFGSTVSFGRGEIILVQQFYSDAEPLFGCGAVIWRNTVIWVWRHYLDAANKFWHSNFFQTLSHYLDAVLLFDATLLLWFGVIIWTRRISFGTAILFRH
jgi:hypothetical protein